MNHEDVYTTIARIAAAATIIAREVVTCELDQQNMSSAEVIIPTEAGFQQEKIRITIERFVTVGEHGGGYKWVKAIEWAKECSGERR